MRTTPLSKEEKNKLRDVLKEMNLIPSPGTVTINFDFQEGISQVETKAVLR